MLNVHGEHRPVFELSHARYIACAFIRSHSLESSSSLDFELDADGRRVLIGLTWRETREFERLDRSLPFEGQHVWPTEGLPRLPMEQRWHELWAKHQAKLAERRRA